MLVLSRKQNQNITFPNLGISVEILRVNGSTVRVGVHAPRDIKILRGELGDGDIAKQVAAEGPGASSAFPSERTF